MFRVAVVQAPALAPVRNRRSSLRFDHHKISTKKFGRI
jgi:hypothetical protein